MLMEKLAIISLVGDGINIEVDILKSPVVNGPKIDIFINGTVFERTSLPSW